MFREKTMCEKLTPTAAVLGGITGFSLGVWACVEYVQPAFEATDGINKKGSEALTALVALGGGIEATTVVGALVGVTALCIIACCAVACTKRTDRENVVRHDLSMFNKAIPADQQHTLTQAFAPNQV